VNILHVTKKYPDALGGDAVVVANLQAQQERAGHRVSILTSNCPEIVSGPRIYKCGISSTSSELDAITPKRIVSLFYLFFRSFGVIKKAQPDVIHTHSIDMAFCIALAAQLFKVPVIHTFHIVTFYDQHQSLLRRKIELWLAGRVKARFITAPNAFDVKKLRDAGFPHAKLLSNGVALDFWTAQEKPVESSHIAPPKSDDDMFTFLATGRLERQKGYSYLIEAASLLKRETDKPFQIVIVGEGAQENMLRARVRALGLENVVRFASRKSKEEIRELLQQADCVVCPSLYETTPLALLEAWAMRVAVIMTPTGILREASPDMDAAYIVPIRDSEKLMHAMKDCIDDTKRRQTIANKGWAEVQQYAWPDIARSAERLYGRANEAA